MAQDTPNEFQPVEQGAQINANERRRLEDLCNIFNIPVARTEPNPAAALVALVHLFALPCVDDEEEFDDFAATIVDYVDDYFVYPARWENLHPRKRSQRRVGDMGDGAFLNVVQLRINQIDWFPWLYSELSKSPEELADLYETLGWVALALKLIGGAAAMDGISAFGAGVGEAASKRSVNAGISRAAQSLMGQSGLARGILSTFGANPFSPVGIALSVGGAAAYLIVVDMMEDIREVLEYRFQSDDVSDSIYERVFGDFNFDATEIRKYGPWEGI